MPALNDFFLRLSKVLKRDLRYRQEAYFFVMNALNRAAGRLERPRHLTGQELLEAIREEAQDQFGPMATTVFEYWGLKNSLDFGMLVFNMVEQGILSKTDTDRLEDFTNEVFFEKLFDHEFHYRLHEDGPNPMEKLKWQTKQ